MSKRATRKSNKPSRPLSREEPFPSLSWYGLALISDIFPESDREPFRQWLIQRNKNLPKADQWPFNFQIPPDYDPPIHNEDLYKIRDHTQWIIKMAFAQNAKSSKATKP
jgi:hypothetical protein